MRERDGGGRVGGMGAVFGEQEVLGEVRGKGGGGEKGGGVGKRCGKWFRKELMTNHFHANGEFQVRLILLCDWSP